MTASQWVSELNALRADLGAGRVMHLKWLMNFPLGNEPLAKWAFNPDSELELALFEVGASGSDLPTVVVRVAAANAVKLSEVRQGAKVNVAGRTEAGGAAAVVLPGGAVIWPVYPCIETRRNRYRWDRLRATGTTAN